MEPIRYNSYANAASAIKHLNIHGPQVDRVVVTKEKHLAIVWIDGSHSLVTHSLFNVLTS